MIRSLYSLFFKIFGWKVQGAVPKSLNQFVIIVAPHTSNWDFMVGLAARSLLRLDDTYYIAKKELFRPPFGWIFRMLGGFPVDRSKNTNLVDAVVDLFKKYPRFSIAITPEGTRSYAPKWKTGFYYIALKAHIPIVMVGFNYARKTVTVEAPFMPTGDVDNDIEFMMAHYRKIPGKNPQNGVT
jgi:1-acyl-sn-glycerol-3-phosphate acyltransferase